MTQLPLPRDNDLPPRWDGHLVEWHGWETQLDVFVCPPPKPACCRACGTKAAALVNRGTVWTDPESADPVVAIGRARLRRGRHLVGNVHAYRCPDCRTDTVLDGVGPDAQVWELDETDYLDTGSWDRAGAPT